MLFSTVRRAISRMNSRVVLKRAAILLVGIVAGIFLSDRIAAHYQDRFERRELSAYANRLVDRAGNLGTEASRSMRTIEQDRQTPCSDRDLAFMRNVVLASEHLRDVGRLQHGQVVCSAILGRVAPALQIPEPEVVMGETSTWDSSWPDMPAALHVHYLSKNGIWVAINEQTLRGQEEQPPRMATELLYDRTNNRMMHSFGVDVPLTRDEIVASRPIERGGVLYEPLCKPHTIVCVVASEIEGAFIKQHRVVLTIRRVTGGLLGALLVTIVMLIDFRRQALEAQLRKALARGELTVVYQPIVDLDTETVVGAEALTRWVKHNGESVPPELFVSLAESQGFVGEITRMVLSRVIAEMGDLLTEENFHVTINVTAQDLITPAFFPELERRVGSAGIPRSAIGIELTERSTADPVVATQALTQLKQAGYPIYIDDFGTGYSSLAYLHTLTVDAIKIDRIFTQTVGTASVTASVVPQILDIARRLDLRVVIEGIETSAQADYFREALPGCQAQGWLYGRPMAAADLRRLLQESHAMQGELQTVR